MKKIILLLQLLLIIQLFFSIDSVCAKETIFPNANEFVYPQYEVTIFNSILSTINDKNADNFKEFIINFEYDLTQNKGKANTIDIIVELQEKLTHTYFKIINDKEFTEFIFKYENSNDYDDITVWKKLVAWVLLRHGMHENNDYDAFINVMLRRREMLRKIIDNNKEQAPLISYMLYVIDGSMIGIDPPQELLESKVKELQILINKYPESEFAPLAKIEIGMNYFNSQKYNDAISCFEDVIKNYKNIYIGGGDLHSDAYSELVKVYETLNDSEKIKFFFNNINTNIEGYNSFKRFYSTYLK